MKKIILGIVFSFVFLTSNVFATNSSGAHSSSEVKIYESLLSTIRTLSTEVNNMRIIGKLTASQEQSFQAVIVNLMNNILARLSNSNVGNSSTDPFISSIDKSSGPIGTTVTLKGSNLAGFEGDLDAWIENSSGEKGYLPGIYSNQVKTNEITVKIPEKACKQINSYSGNPCTSYLNITPGIYKLYTSPWGKKSNIVTFEVTDKNTNNAKAFFISPNHQGDDEYVDDCKNAVIGVNIEVSKRSPLRDSINILLNSGYLYGESGLINPLSEYDFEITKLDIIDRTARLKMEGKDLKSGYCNLLVIFEQLSNTMKQFSTVDKVEIYVNNENLADALNH